MMKERSNSYWEKRANARMEHYHRSSDKTINTVTSAYDKAIEDINKEIETIFEKYSNDGILSPTEARELLNAPLTRREINELKDMVLGIKDERIRMQLLSRINAPAYAARITRLQALKEKVYIESKKIADVEINADKLGFMDTINDAYYRTMFDIQKGLGASFDVATMPSKTIESILKNPWSGKHFSERVWGNTNVLASKLTGVITSGMMSGRSLDKMVKELEFMGNMGKHAAARIIRTETTYMANAAEMESYKEAEIDKYIFIATLDLRTSDICKEHDNNIFEVDKAVPGENMPPLHPNCRSTTIAYFGEETLKGIERRAVDPETGQDYKIPADMTYEQWYKEKFVDKYGQDKAEVMKKKIINKASDKRQHERYRGILGDEVPKLIDDFQELKYNDGNQWNIMKDYFKARVQGNISSFSTFRDYKHYKSEIEKNLVGVSTLDGIDIKSYSKHFIDRVLGTSNDYKTDKPRSGVDIIDVLDALKNPVHIIGIEERKLDIKVERSKKYIGEKATVSINPDTGNLIQCNPSDSDKVRRLKSRNGKSI